MSAGAAHDKFTGKHITLDVKTPDLEEPEESPYAEPVSVGNRSHAFYTYSRESLTSLSPLFPIFGIQKRRLRPLKQQLNHTNHHCLR